MQVPMSWLKEYTQVNCDTKTFADKMTMSGSKVEDIHYFGDDLDKIVVGKVLSIEKHPGADKLVVCQVDIGTETVQIVTGATNLNPEDYVPVALDGSTVSGGKQIKKGKLRGEISNGMMCSIEELGYTLQDYPEAVEDGIFVLDKPYELGADIRPILQLCEDVVEFEITSNRSDCHSVLGIAREAAATLDVPFQPPVITLKEEGQGDIHSMVAVEIENPELCPRYIARVVKNVKIGPSPLWLRHRLTTAGIRPINNIVDITNYVMLEMGQPMHAFDIEGIALDANNLHKIIVRNAQEGEKFTTLDGTERTLDAGMLVIADCQKAVAVAGVMGGENSKVTEHASAILFESANFNGTNVRLTSKRLGLRTDASGKYEKGLDPNLSLAAVNRAVQLVEMLECGDVLPGMAECYPNPRHSWEVAYSPENINKLLGTNISSEEMAAMLEKLGIAVKDNVATIPTFRPDMTLEADIAEEVARMYGYDKLETTLAAGTPTVGKKSFKQKIEDIIKDTMVAYGFYEALHYAFESPKVFDKLNIEADSALRKAITIKNPLGEDFSIMRTTTVNAMLQSLATNFNRRNAEAALFELAKIYVADSLPLADMPKEPHMLTLGAYGNWDYFRLNGVVTQLFNRLGIKGVTFSTEKNIPFMHPGRCAAIAHPDYENLGFIGEVHPSVAAQYGIETKVYIAVIHADFMADEASLDRTYTPLPKFPGIDRDIAMLVKDDLAAAEIEAAIRARGGNMLKEVTLFDVYKGKQIAEGYKSMAYTLSFRADDRTLTDEEVTKAVRKVISHLEMMLGAQLRDK